MKNELFSDSDIWDAVCITCGLIIGDKNIHSAFHGKLDALFVLQIK